MKNAERGIDVDIDVVGAAPRDIVIGDTAYREPNIKSPPNWGTNRLDRNVRLLGLGAGVRLFGAAMVYPFLSLYLKNVARLGYAEIGVLITVVSILPLAVSPFGGLLADRVGRRSVFLLFLGGEAASMLLIAVSMSFTSIVGVLLGGGLAGVASAIAGPAISAYVADLTQLADRTMAYTWVRIGFNGGFTLGVALGGVLIGFIGFPNTGYLAAAILVGSTFFLLLTLTPSPYDIARARGATPATTAAAVASPGSIKASIRILLRDKTFLVLCLATLFASVVYGHWSTTFPLYSNTILLVPYGILGIALALNGAIVFFGQTPMTKMMTGHRHTYSAMLATVLLAASFVAIGGLSLVTGAALVAVFAFVVILTIGENFGAIPSMTLPSNVAPATEVGSYNGAFNLFQGIGSSISPLIGGVVLAYFTNPLVIWLILALPAIPAILLYDWVGTRIPAAANTV
jgi:MFS transporter, DHA1 family, multidrug resistance protein B